MDPVGDSHLNNNLPTYATSIPHFTLTRTKVMVITLIVVTVLSFLKYFKVDEVDVVFYMLCDKDNEVLKLLAEKKPAKKAIQQRAQLFQRYQSLTKSTRRKWSSIKPLTRNSRSVYNMTMLNTRVKSAQQKSDTARNFPVTPSTLESRCNTLQKANQSVHALYKAKVKAIREYKIQKQWDDFNKNLQAFFEKTSQVFSDIFPPKKDPPPQADLQGRFGDVSFNVKF